MDPFKHLVFRSRFNEDEPAIATIDGVITYRGLISAVAAASQALGTLGLDRKTLVALDVKNRFFHIALMIALGLRGVPSASMQTRMSVVQSGILPALVLTDTSGSAFEGVRTIEITPQWFATGDANVRPDYTALLAMPGFTDDSDLVRVAFSSGTTGFPKAVALRRGVLAVRMVRMAQREIPGRHRAVLMFGPSILGVYIALIEQFARGGLICFAANADEMIRMTRIYQVTSMALAVAQLRMILTALEDRPPLATLQCLIITGSKLTLPALREAQAKLCASVLSAYGSTEAGSLTTGTGEMLARQEGAVGYLYPDVAMEIVDRQHRPLPRGETGVIRVKTEEMLEYLNPTPDTDEMFREGWFYPGDIGSIDKDGVVTLIGRTSEVINHGGAIVAPEYVEDVLRTVPGIREVAVFGVPNATGFEDIWAAVVADDRLDPETIIPAVRERLIDKLPDRIVRVTEIPRGGEMAKVRRKELRERVLAIPGVRD